MHTSISHVSCYVAREYKTLIKMQVICEQIKYRRKTNVYDAEIVSRKAFLGVSPSRLKFTFDVENFTVQEKIIEITNYFSKPCPVQLLPLETQYFRIRNVSQKKWLNPGSIFKINILFIPDENRNYNDILKIRYFYDQLTEIKIIAKVVNIFSFPTTVNFGNVPLGQPICYEIPMHPHATKEFSFAILPSKEISCVDIYPRWGRIKPGQEPLIIMVIYRPLRFISMHFHIRIFISNLCKTPYVINFYAYTRPGLLLETIENIEPKMESKRSRKRIGSAQSYREIKSISLTEEKVKKSHVKEHVTKHTSFGKLLIEKCGRFPLYSLHATNCILNTKIKRFFDEYELNGPLGMYLLEVIEQKAQKQKEFWKKIKNRRHENELAKLHNKPKINYDIDETQITEIKTHREQIWDEYKNLITSPEKELFERPRANKLKQRILRVAHKYPDTTWISTQNEVLFLHYYKITPFLQAARKIILKNRLLKVLEKLRNFMRESINESNVIIYNESPQYHADNI